MYEKNYFLDFIFSYVRFLWKPVHSGSVALDYDYSEAYLEPGQTSKMELIVRILNSA